MIKTKLHVNSRSLFSFITCVNDHCVRPRRAASFWFAGINKCKPYWIEGKWRGGILAPWDQSPVPSWAVRMAAPPSSPEVIRNQLWGQLDPSWCRGCCLSRSQWCGSLVIKKPQAVHGAQLRSTEKVFQRLQTGPEMPLPEQQAWSVTRKWRWSVMRKWSFQGSPSLL